MGQVAHTTACLYLEAFAHRHNHNSEDCPWMVVNWDVWKADKDTQGEADEKWAGSSSALAKIAMTPTEGANAFQRLLYAGAYSRILVSGTDPRLRREAIRMMQASRGARHGDTANGLADTSGGHERPDLATPYQPPRNEDEAAMAELWQEFLGIEKIGIYDNFFDLGGHSLLATQLVSRLQQTFHINVELDIFFSAPSIAELTAALLRKQLEQHAGSEMTQLLDKLEEMTEEEAEALLNSGSLPAELLDALTAKES